MSLRGGTELERPIVIDEDEWIPISALEHWSYCPRQYALIHLEGTYDENAYTMRGRYNHERVHTEGTLVVGADLVERSLPLFSRRLGLTGKADVVEDHSGVPYPIEYKSGADVGARHADIQVCAQAICLEEMTGVSVPRGAVYHCATRRRREVVFDDVLRGMVEQAAEALRTCDFRGPLPPPAADARCRACSLVDACLPYVAKRARSLSRLAA